MLHWNWPEKLLLEPVPPIWLLIPHIINLESLELECKHDTTFDSQLIACMDEPPFPKLQCARLFGYVPRELAAWVLSA